MRYDQHMNNQTAAILATASSGAGGTFGVVLTHMRYRRELHDSREQSARAVTGAIEKRSRVIGGQQTPLMHLVVANRSTAPVWGVEALVPCLGWVSVPWVMPASVILEPGEHAEGLGLQPPTWTPQMIPIAFVNDDGRWRRDRVGNLHVDRFSSRFLRRLARWKANRKIGDDGSGLRDEKKSIGRD